MGGVLFGEDTCSCGNATGKPVVFGCASKTGGHAFPFAWEQQIPSQGSFGQVSHL